MSTSLKDLEERLQKLEGRTFATETYLEEVLSFLGRNLPEKYFLDEIDRISVKIQNHVKKKKTLFDCETEKLAFLEKVDDIGVGFAYREANL